MRIKDVVRIQINDTAHEIEHEYDQPQSVAEAVSVYGEDYILQMIQWALQIEKRSDVRKNFLNGSKFKTPGRGKTTGPRGK
jgi:hypothetical protein